MGKRYYAGAILALLITLAACGGEYTPSKEEAQIIESLEKGNKITPMVKDTSYYSAMQFETEFITLPEGKIIKEKKVFEISEKFILIDGDTINRDREDMGYIVIKFPYKQVKSFPIKLNEGAIQLGDLTYSKNLPKQTVPHWTTYKVVKGDTRKVLLAKGIPSYKIPKIPQVGQIITW